jgi:hypothetical protein
MRSIWVAQGLWAHRLLAGHHLIHSKYLHMACVASAFGAGFDSDH